MYFKKIHDGDFLINLRYIAGSHLKLNPLSTGKIVLIKYFHNRARSIIQQGCPSSETPYCKLLSNLMKKLWKGNILIFR